MLAAFNSKPEVRTAALARLNERFKAGTLTPGAMFFNGKLATPAAALIDSSDGQVWEAQLGLAQWMAFAIDYATARFSGERTIALVGELLGSVPLGSDTGRLGCRVVNEVLASVAQQLAECGEQTRPLIAACEDIQKLHGEILAGGAPSPAAWRLVRKKAVQATDDLSDPLEKSLGACVEGAAWNPIQSPTSVGDVLRLRGQVPVEHVNKLFGWTDEDDKRIRRLLGEMHEKYLKDKPFAGKDVFMHLREDHPEAEARLLAYTKFQKGENARAAEQAAQQLLHVAQGVQ
ncbi:hypothetical protein OOZ63_17975 [Paucibacter sp. PLA-PC-4]|uniref:hypothetical protein n=1 Tax=Paucibacter sp. PLA-PC-4 TaxID=2993655 RepID=UPI00224AC88B|nr:hypothetical protein [Paucibacter sp. PLA-PC-4]MCX2863720.1 hypothetical protein [Paucibacter sp. PLA-PC-4]